MIEALLGLLVGLPVMWGFSKLANLPKLADLKTRKYALMKKAFKHTGSFSELLVMQREILALSFQHLASIFVPAIVSCIPIIALLAWKPDYATLAFGGGILVAYLFAKWRWRI